MTDRYFQRLQYRNPAMPEEFVFTFPDGAVHRIRLRTDEEVRKEEVAAKPLRIEICHSKYSGKLRCDAPIGHGSQWE